MMHYVQISIIIPIYNVEQYLEQCLDSVIGQSYKNLQIILVDDGSTDSSADICRKYEKKDSRIIFIQKENGGLSDARNVGTSIATGEFTFYLDSDDFLESNAIEILEMLQRKEDYDIVLGNYYYVYPESKYEAKHVFVHEMSLNNYEAMEALMTGNIQSFAWGKLFRTNIVQKYLFPKGRLFEDHYWTHLVFGEAKKIGITSQPVVNYRQRNDSISYSFDINRLDMFDGWIKRKKYLEQYYPRLINKALANCARQYVQTAWLVLIKMRFDKKFALKKMRQYNSKLQLQNYCEGEQKKLIESLQKNYYLYAFKAVIDRIKKGIK